MQIKLLFVGLSLCLSAEMWTNSEYITGACRIKPKKTVPRRPLHHGSDFIYHVKRDDWQEEWGDTDKKMRKSFKTKCKSTRLKNILDFEKPVDFSINLSQGCPHFCVLIYFSNEKLTEIYQLKSK